MSERRPSPRRTTGLGKELRDARLGRGYSIEDCQRATRIARRYLEALEDEDFSALPAPVFARGFLRSYAQCLGLDPTALLARFPVNPRAPGGAPAEPPEARRDVSPIRLESAAPYYEDEFAQDQALPPIPRVEPRPSTFRLGPWLVAAFVVLVVCVGVVVVVIFEDDEPGGTAPVSAVPGTVGPADVEGQDDAVTISLGVPEGIRLPDFSNTSVTDAQLWLRRAGAPFVIFEIFDPGPFGLVIDQLPPPGAALDSGSTVTVVVSRGPAPAPQSPAPEAAAPAGAAPADAAADGPGAP